MRRRVTKGDDGRRQETTTGGQDIDLETGNALVFVLVFVIVFVFVFCVCACRCWAVALRSTTARFTTCASFAGHDAIQKP